MEGKCGGRETKKMKRREWRKKDEEIVMEERRGRWRVKGRNDRKIER